MIDQLMNSLNSNSPSEVVGAFLFIISAVVFFLFTLLIFIVKMND